MSLGVVIIIMLRQAIVTIAGEVIYTMESPNQGQVNIPPSLFTVWSWSLNWGISVDNHAICIIDYTRQKFIHACIPVSNGSPDSIIQAKLSTTSKRPMFKPSLQNVGGLACS